MMPDDATDRRTGHGMAARYMSHDTAHRGTFQAAFRTTQMRKERHRYGNDQTKPLIAHVDLDCLSAPRKAARDCVTPGNWNWPATRRRPPSKPRHRSQPSTPSWPSAPVDG